jgi:hypothetical protein
MSIFKGIGKTFKRVGKGLNQFVKSDAGKAVIAIAAVYLGGAALTGSWTWGAGAAGAGGAGGAAGAGAFDATASGMLTTEGGLNTAYGLGQAGALSSSFLPSAGAVGGGAVGGGAVGGGLAGWMQANPVASVIGSQAISGALTPSESEIYAQKLKDDEKAERRSREARNKRMLDSTGLDMHSLYNQALNPGGMNRGA